MNRKLYNVGLYVRLSQERKNYLGEENSSINMMPGRIAARTYIDEGVSGTTSLRV
jgi:hypothetical protein